MTQIQNSNPESSKNLKLILHFGFFISGIATVLIGQVLPVLALRFTLSDEQAAYFFTAQLAGSISGALINSQLYKSLGFGRASVIGCFAMTIGVLGINSGSWPLCLAAFFINGIGIGITLPSINMLVAELNPQKTNYALNLLNFFWGFGAILCKPFVDYAGYGGSVLIPTFILAATLFFVGIALFLSPSSIGKKIPREENTEPVPNFPIWTTLTGVLILLFNFIHVGFESAIGGWVTTYSTRISGDNSISWISPTLAYFLFFVIGRAIAPFFSLRFSENKMLFPNLLIMTIGIYFVIFANGMTELFIGASITGLGTSSVFPTNMSRFTKIFGEASTRRVTPLFIAGSVGSAFTTWLIGYVSTAAHNLSTGMFVLLVSCFLLIAVQILLAYKHRLRA